MILRGQRRKLGDKFMQYSVLIVSAILLAFPFYWMLIATFKQNIDLYNTDNNPFIFNLPPTLDHLKLLFNETRYVRWLGNTALVGVHQTQQKDDAAAAQ